SKHINYQCLLKSGETPDIVMKTSSKSPLNL
ncbi:MAG: hypothetical protein ACI9UJ_001015, partial [bacterium]